ncbi:TPA: glucose-6-phosphate dehydrogenase [Legionella pneumophila]|uniref:Glucose-6-phosphate 1-dehydrogenase n=1 Tax=Legionella pneumophila TaxID=446 RepID=A0AAN5KQJ6_LEGPN|nr:glucose-6-phosphate dehydrogenase [Legionella pneumophila]HAT1972388.1 glucose-6-phosphate dehydrogenase [Legionella pneumophila]HAT6956680.1 glucose-6-phosphate dehydrogenase [Legionella pneumophila]HEN4770047.1 glucose-6-phosphate dehydrogenase [Legionella pneumophila]
MLLKAESKYPCDLILFGTLGDLSCRKLLPALYQLELANLLHEKTRIIGCAREELDFFAYVDLIKHKIQQFLFDEIDEAVWLRFIKKLTYCKLDLNQSDDYQKLTDYVNPSERVVISYLAIPPGLYSQTCRSLARLNLTERPSRVVLEKPIGHDLPSSVATNDQVACFFAEDQIYRIDHYLGKETVLNLLVLRFANSIFSTNWDNRVIDRVEISVAEEIGVEGRWEYYDKSGQVRDMLQNHLLQILSLIAMEPPLSLSAESIRSEKLKVLKSLRFINKSNVHDHTVRAQYVANNLSNGKKIRGYLEEEGANQASKTETFVAIKAYVDNWRWSGVPFYMLTGKRLPKKQSEVVIYFKPQPYNIFHPLKEELYPNQLIIRLQPDEGVEVRIMNKIPGLGERMELHDTKLDLNFHHSFKTRRIADAYERLLLEVMLGNQYLFVSREEIEQAWQWIDSIISAWEEDNIPLYTYPACTWGPTEVIRLFNGQAHVWGDHNAVS